MKTTKLLTTIAVVWLISIYEGVSQCSNITVNGSTQNPNSVCAPVDFNMEAKYQFLIPVDTSLVRILFRWNDGTGATTLISGNWNAAGDSVWGDASHLYPPTDECSRTAEAILVYDGELCLSSGYQEQTFATWGTDEENSGILSTDPVVHSVCEGEDIVDVIFADNSTFNCNINIEPDRPNRYYRWVQFIYNTYTQAGDRIPDVTVRDNLGTVHNMTDNTGAFVGNLNGPVIRIPIPADGPNQVSYPISAPAGGVAGDIFEITLRNWNVCNPFDNNPEDGFPPADTINGDNPPITTTARIEIIAPTPVTVPALFEFCTGDNILLTANAGIAEIRWYKDIGRDTLLYVGNNFNPTSSPYPVNASSPGSYRFYVTSYEGFCESAPTTVNLVIYQTPEDANAGIDKVICADTVTLSANVPSAGSGIWTTSGGALIANPSSPTTFVSNLDSGPNTFSWTIINGPCNTSDNVVITSDRQPSPADAGSDTEYCDTDPVTLNASVVTNGGTGYWNILTGSGNIADTTDPVSDFINPGHGSNILVWRVFSRYGACPVTSDSVEIFADYSAGIADAGITALLCETGSYNLAGNSPINNGSGYWYLFSGTGTFSDSTDPNTTITGLNYGTNRLVWTLESLYGICSSSSDTIEIERHQTPGIANAGIDKSYCLVNQDTLDGNSPAIGSGQWQVIENPSGIPPVFSPNNLDPNAIVSVAAGNEGRYVLVWFLQNGVCSTSDTVEIDFGVPVPPADAGPDTLTCGYDYQMQANSISTGMGTWRTISGPGPVQFTSGLNDPNTNTSFIPGNEGNYLFEWRLTSGSCPASADTVEIGIKKAPIPPVLTDIQACGPDSFQISISVTDPDQIINWYDTDISPTPFYIGNTYNTGLLTTSESYYISLFDTLTWCETERVEQQIEINEIPPLPIISGDTLCGGGNANLTGFVSPPGDRIIWYSDREGLLPFDTGFSITVNNINKSTWIYSGSLVSSTGCLSDVDSILIVVFGKPDPPVVIPDSSCGSSAFTLSAIKSDTANSLFWYDNAGGLIAVSDSLITAIIDSTTNFYAAEYNSVTQCLSNQNELTVTINSLPPVPEISDTFSCGAASFDLVPVQDNETTDFWWYYNPIDSLPFYIGDTLSTPILTANETYWVSGINTVTGCMGSLQQVDVDIYPSPAAIDILGPTVVLKDQSGVVFFTINGQPGSTYTWNIPSEITIEENKNDFVRLGFPNTGNFTISVYETTVNGCIGTPIYHSISVILDSIAVDIGNFEQGACTASIFDLQPWLFGGTPPFTYSWTGDTEYLSSTNTLFTQFSPPGIGTYKLYLEVIDINLKSARDSVLIIVYESPVTNITNTDTIACVDEDFQLTTNSSGEEPFTHLWTGPVHNLNSYGISNPVYTPRQTDTAKFYYVITDINGCKAYDSITLVSDMPVADFNILTQPGCSPLNVEFENLSTGAVRYNWYFGDNTQTTAENPVHQYSNTSPEIKYMEVNLLAVSPLGCTDQETKYVMVWPNPLAELTALPQNGCNPAHILLVSTPGNSLYHWNFGDGSGDTTTTGFNLYHTFTNESFEDQTFTASVITQSSLDCYDTAYIDVTVYATPASNFSVIPAEQTFPENAFEVDNQTQGNWEYNWDYGDGRGSTKKNPGTIRYEETGVFTISLRATGEHCSDSSNEIIRLHPAPPAARFKGADNGCMPHTVTLVNESTYADSYLWEFGDGSISTAKDPSYTYYEPGIYKIKLTVSGMGGTSVFSDTTRVYILPNSFFDLAPRYVYVNDEPVNYFNLSDEADVFEWNFGDGTTSTEFNPKHVYKNAGTYDVTLKVWTENGCFDLYVMENAVFAEPSGMVKYPNAFRPSSPLEENRVFKPGVIDHVDDYHLMIFNRWGELIFESFNQETGWDGTYKGKIAKQDVYIWMVKGTYTDGKGFEKTGNVTLLY